MSPEIKKIHDEFSELYTEHVKAFGDVTDVKTHVLDGMRAVSLIASEFITEGRLITEIADVVFENIIRSKRDNGKKI